MLLPHPAATEGFPTPLVATRLPLSERRWAMNKTRNLVFVSLLIALEIIFTRYLSIQTDIVRISFGFIPIALVSILFGPITGGIAAMLADLLGMMIFPKGAYFPGFTFNAFVTGVIYGIFLYRKPKSMLRIAGAVFTVTIVVTLILTPLWLSITLGKAFIVIVVSRLVSTMIMIPIKIISIQVAWHWIGALIEKSYFPQNIY